MIVASGRTIFVYKYYGEPLNFFVGKGFYLHSKKKKNTFSVNKISLCNLIRNTPIKAYTFIATALNVK